MAFYYFKNTRYSSKKKPRYSAKDKRAFWTGFGARLVRHKSTNSNNVLKRIFNGKHGQSFKNGIARADRINKARYLK